MILFLLLTDVTATIHIIIQLMVCRYDWDHHQKSLTAQPKQHPSSSHTHQVLLNLHVQSKELLLLHP